MNARNPRIGSVAVLLTLLMTAAQAFAQEGGAPEASAQAQQPGVAAATAPARAPDGHVVGTLVALDTERLDLMVERAVGPSADSASVLVGQTHTFTLDAGTVKPPTLAVGDHVDLWFSERDGVGYAVRIAPASDDGEGSDAAVSSPPPAPPAAGSAPRTSAPADTSPSGTTSATANSSPGAGAPAAAAQKPRSAEAPAAPVVNPAKPLVPPAVVPAAPGVSAAPDTGLTGAPAAPAPDPADAVGAEANVGALGSEAARVSAPAPPSGDPLPFVGVGVVAAALALGLLYLTLRRRGQILDLGLHAGKGGGV